MRDACITFCQCLHDLGTFELVPIRYFEQLGVDDNTYCLPLEFFDEISPWNYHQSAPQPFLTFSVLMIFNLTIISYLSIIDFYHQAQFTSPWSPITRRRLQRTRCRGKSSISPYGGIFDLCSLYEVYYIYLSYLHGSPTSFHCAYLPKCQSLCARSMVRFW